MSAPRRRLRAAHLASALLVAGCSGSPEAPRVLARLSIWPAAPSIEVGQTTQLGVQASDADGSPMLGVDVSWQSGDPAVASVTSLGLVRGMAKGVTTIRATAEGVSDSTKVYVALTRVASVAITDASIVMQIGAIHRLTAKALDDQRQPLGPRATTWHSSNPSIATVSDSGVVTALAPGVTSIVVAIEGVTDSATVRVDTAAVTGDIHFRIGRLWWYLDVAFCSAPDTMSLSVHWQDGLLQATTSQIRLHCEGLFGSRGDYGFPAQDAAVGVDGGLEMTLRLNSSGNGPASLTLQGDLSSGGTAVLLTGPPYTKENRYAGGWSVIPP